MSKTYMIVYEHEEDIWRTLCEEFVTTAHSSNPSAGDIIFNIYKNKNRKKSLVMKYKCVRMATETEISRYSGIPNKCIPVSKGMNTPVWLNFTFTTTQGGLMLRKDRLRFKHEYDSVTFLTNNYLKEAA